MKLGPLTVLIFGLSCIIGGAIGYIRAESVPSLLVGGGGGLVLLFCARAMHKTGNKLAGLIALLLSAVIGGKFVISYLGTRDFMPHGVMVALALLSVVASIRHLLQRRARA